MTFAAADLADEDGRPVGEVASGWYDDDATELGACPYHDVRHGQVMNVSALRQLSRVWPEVRSTLRWLAGSEATGHAALRAIVTALAVPLAWEAAHPGVPVPRVLSVLFKASLGLSQVTTTLLLADDGVADTPLTSLGDAKAFSTFLDDGRWLVGQTQACAGSTHRIGQAFEAIAGFGPDPAPPPALAEFDTARLGDEALETLALQCAAIGWAYQAKRRGEALPAGLPAWVTTPKAPWLRGVSAVPDRRPEHARRLFLAGRTPAALEVFLAATNPLEGGLPGT